MVRFKHRYLLVHLLFPSTLPSFPLSSSSSAAEAAPPPPIQLNEAALISLLRDSLSVNFGDVGAGEVGGSFGVKYLSPHTNIVIIRVSREHYRTLWQALTLLRKVGGQEVIARVLHVGGTIRKTQHAAIAHDRTEIHALAAARRRRRRLLKSHSGVAAAGGGGEEADEETQKLLQESEETLLGMEA